MAAERQVAPFLPTSRGHAASCEAVIATDRSSDAHHALTRLVAEVESEEAFDRQVTAANR